MIDRIIAEATECDFKVALETRKPKSWQKSVSAFANGIGGVSLSRHLSVSEATIKRDIDSLSKSGIIKRVGPDKGGLWSVLYDL